MHIGCNEWNAERVSVSTLNHMLSVSWLFISALERSRYETIRKSLFFLSFTASSRCLQGWKWTVLSTCHCGWWIPKSTSHSIDYHWVFFCLVSEANLAATCIFYQHVAGANLQPWLSPSSNVTAHPRNLSPFFSQRLTLLSKLSSKETCSPDIDTKVFPCVMNEAVHQVKQCRCVCVRPISDGHSCKLHPKGSGPFKKYYPPNQNLI